jgi:hypothetical protein
MTDMTVYSSIFCCNRFFFQFYVISQSYLKVQLIYLLLLAVVLQMKFERQTSVMNFVSGELAANAHYYPLVDSTMYPWECLTL